MRWVVLLLLAGCVSQAEVDQRRAYEREQRAAARQAQIEAKCRGMGFPDGPEFRQCVLQLHGQASQQDAAERAVILQRLLR